MGGIAGPIAGGLMGMMGGGKGGGSQNTSQSTNQSTTQSQTPWAQQIPYILEMFKRAQGGLDQAPQGLGLNTAASGQLQKTLSGDYLYGNPESTKAIDAITQSTMNRVTPSLDSKFAASGRYGSGLHKAAMGQQIADTSAGEMAKNYAAERSNMMGAAGMAPGVADSLDWQQKRLRDFASMISQNFGGTSSGTSSGTSNSAMQEEMSRNPWAGLLGGAMAGSNIFGRMNNQAPQGNPGGRGAQLPRSGFGGGK